ncbi:S8 family serine peptidase [Streptomyces otsuchiensis]|uniref:S8 family serine peptidase n=2 Tax=Streptomyces TaxID=1883 RepID=UPI0010324388|nr:S8 family serine peptidase [Streptomyces otsuchiensis]
MYGDLCRRAAAGTAAAVLPALAMLTLVSVPAHAQDDPVSLPPLVLRLADDAPCTGASETTVESRPWTWRALQLARSWELSTGEGVTVGVVSTGVGDELAALGGRVAAIGDAGEDCVGHGSFVAGLIAGTADGDAPVAGVAPDARVLAARGTDERGAPDADSLAEGIRGAVDGGASVVYVGLALRGESEEVAAAVEEAVEADVLVVAPAAPDVAEEEAPRGEELPQQDYWPASMPQVLSVIDFGPQDARPEGAPLPLYADLAAPGGAVVGVGPQGGGHYLGSGSSLAAAHVAGAAALVRSYQPELDAGEVFRRLTASAYPDIVPRLDVVAALTTFLDVPGTVPEPAPGVVPPAAPDEPAERALWAAGIGVAVALLVAALIAVVPRGKARGWRPAGEEPPGAPPGGGRGDGGGRVRQRRETEPEGDHAADSGRIELPDAVPQSRTPATPGGGTPMTPHGGTPMSGQRTGDHWLPQAGPTGMVPSQPPVPPRPPVPPTGGHDAGGGGGR